jgi:Flp pilus assembly protein protease CpaA
MKKAVLILNMIGGLVLYVAGVIGAAETSLVYDLSWGWEGMLVSGFLICFGTVVMVLNLIWLVEPGRIETHKKQKEVKRKQKSH